VILSATKNPLLVEVNCLSEFVVLKGGSTVDTAIIPGSTKNKGGFALGHKTLKSVNGVSAFELEFELAKSQLYVTLLKS